MATFLTLRTFLRNLFPRFPIVLESKRERVDAYSAARFHAGHQLRKGHLSVFKKPLLVGLNYCLIFCISHIEIKRCSERAFCPKNIGGVLFISDFSSPDMFVFEFVILKVDFSIAIRPVFSWVHLYLAILVKGKLWWKVSRESENALEKFVLCRYPVNV